MNRRAAFAAILVAGFMGELAVALLLYPLLQRYLVFDRHLPVGMPGYILAAYGLARLLAQVPLSGVADRVNPRLVVLIGYLAVLVAGLGLSAPLRSGLLLVIAAVFGLGHALADPVLPAAIAESAGAGAHARALALFNLCSVAGLVVGLAGGAFVAELAPPAAGFLLVAVANGLTLVLAVAAPLARRRKQASRRAVSGMWRALSNARVIEIMAVLFLVALAVNLLLPDLSLYSVERLHTSLHVLTLYLIPAIGAGVAALLLGGWWADRDGRLLPLLAGIVLGVIGLVLLSFARRPWQAAIAALPCAAGLAMTMPASNAAVLDVADLDHRVLLLGGMMAAQGAAQVVGPLLSGVLTQLGGIVLTLGVAAGVLWLALPSAVFFASTPYDGKPGRVVPYTPLTRALSRLNISLHKRRSARVQEAPPSQPAPAGARREAGAESHDTR